MGSADSGKANQEAAGASQPIQDLRASPGDTAGGSQQIQDLRRDFGRDSLTEELAGDDPFLLFGRWFDTALDAGLRDANAFVLSTVDEANRPVSRVLLLKDYSPAGFVFYTNYASRKGSNLAENPHAAILFYWAEHERQVRIEGRVERVAREESAAYFASRPRASQLGAHASPQSQVLSDRSDLEKRFSDLEQQYGADAPIPLPEDWGGYRLQPGRIEFWQGRSNRLHDRLEYTIVQAGSASGSQAKAGAWTRVRLAP
ncbi:MAG: pyridoxamine 5'-phosphate oxidase [bacterium]|nr:pyridoxamine 5'-phosphate oxidase [bacterium]